MFVDNKVALVTGGATGLGFEYALELLRNNLRAVTLADIDDVKGQDAADQIAKKYGANKAIFVKTDVTNLKQVEEAFRQTVETFGNLDIVINNAGIMNDAIWEKEIAINVNGTIHGCLLAMEEYIPQFKSADEGVIVNISSGRGLRGYSILPIYSATKHAIIGLGRSLGTPDQYETSKVRVLTICPGPTDTALLLDLEEKPLNERYLGLLRNFIKEIGTFPAQGVNNVSKCLLKVIEEGANGSIWVVERDETYEIEIPDRQQMKKK